MSVRFGIACGALVVSAVLPLPRGAQAKPHSKPTRAHKASQSAEYERAMNAVATLTAEVKALHEEVQSLRTNQHADQAQVQQAKATAEAAQQQVQTAQAQEAEANAAIIQTIPTQVASAVDAAKPKTDAFYYKGVKITPGGFLEAASIYRARNMAADIATPFNTVPFASTRAGHEDELKFSERQSRISALIQGNVNLDTTLGMYGEFDFQGAAQNGNYNETNSFNPRVRHLYGTIDWNDEGWHLLAGQTFSLATLDSKGITPRNEVTPPQIDAQYLVGFVWTRQPQVRLTKEFDKKLWVAVSLENPQTTFTGTVPAGVTNNIANNAGVYAGDTGTLTTTINAAGDVTAVSGVATATQSLNHLPDLIAKAAYEDAFYGHLVHGEVFGMGRAYSDRIGTSNDTVYGGGVGFGLTMQVIPGLFDVQGSGLTGRGVGRYGAAQLPDVTFAPNGRIEPINENIWLAGGTVHATKQLDVYAFAGEEHEDRQTYSTTYGYGSGLLNLGGCLTEGGACSAATKYVSEETIGFWDKFYQGPFGRMQFGVQASLLERHAFSGLNGIAPIANNPMVFTSLRYYPF